MKEIYCVALGPGDPELVTLKAARLVKTSDIVFCPGTKRGDQIISRAGDLLEVIGVSREHIRYFSVPMSTDRSDAIKVYQDVADEIKEAHDRGQVVSFVAEGDSGIYCSVHYISDYLEEMGLAVTQIAGIPAFIAAGATAGLHIVKQHEPLLVLPSTTSSAQITDEVRRGKTVVLMKMSRQEQTVKEALGQLQGANVHYFENIGVEGREYHTTSIEDIVERKFPYFSLMIIKND